MTDFYFGSPDSQQDPMDFFHYTLYEAVYERKGPAHCTGWRFLPMDAIIYCHEGEYHWLSENGEKYICHAGEAFVIPADTPHHLTMYKPYSHSFIHISCSLMNAFELLSMYNCPRVIFGEAARKMVGYIREISVPLSENANPIEAAIVQREAVYGILKAVLSLSTPRTPSSPPDSIFKLYPVLNHISKNLGTIAGRKELASLMNLSETRFHYIFKEAMGVSPVKYLIKARFREAQTLLISTDSPIADIAKSVGYSDAFNFSKQFKKKFGINPSEFRTHNYRKYPQI